MTVVVKVREALATRDRLTQAQDCGVVLTSYGRALVFFIDLIEKKPLNHFLFRHEAFCPLGTADCDPGCRFARTGTCQKRARLTGYEAALGFTSRLGNGLRNSRAHVALP
jgi:hypothetical protein